MIYQHATDVRDELIAKTLGMRITEELRKAETERPRSCRIATGRSRTPVRPVDIHESLTKAGGWSG